ncbi:hypothetical protein PAXINDRAFT_20012 [Paxillus involutus ATCC 200175]|uniref:Unplaced genomic scaffold PAXINscaffold_837, whole genome shotgun sequence n=1 Tax=Paxillus involutus ATCC 200175 TaxID=664439 RepID=A0A0C9T646_PAXIN|nr:hypothetical protein PAXINDRAFT_20012 [Paxillus involutus ATCC 200175]
MAVVLGTCPSVGAAGFMQAGGHGPLTPALGLGVDHILQYELVTADGEIRTLNAVQDLDLFWAVCGGGLGSWGLITSIMIKAHPATRVSTVQFVIRPADGEKKTQRVINFIALVGRYQHGWVIKGIASSFVPDEENYLLNLYWPSNQGDSAVLVFVDELLSHVDEYTIVSFQTSMFASVTEAEEKVLGPFANRISPYGASMQMSSQLIPLSSLESARGVAEAIWAGLEGINAVLRKGGLPNAAPLIFGSMPGAHSVP